MSDQVSTIAMADTAKPSGVRWKIFLLMLFLISINYIDRASLSVAMPVIAKDLYIDIECFPFVTWPKLAYYQLHNTKPTPKSGTIIHQIN